MITGVDLVAWQLRIAASEKLTIQQAIMSDAGFAAGGYTCAFLPENPGLLENT